MPDTGGWDSYENVQAPVTGGGDETRDLCIVFTGDDTATALLDLDRHTFTGPGVTTPSGAAAAVG